MLFEPKWFTFRPESGQVKVMVLSQMENNEMMAILITEMEAKAGAQIISLLINHFIIFIKKSSAKDFASLKTIKL